GMSGFVRDQDGQGIAFADIDVTNRATGVVTRGRSRDGGILTISGLEPGGPYSISVQRIGYRPQARDSLWLSLGQTLLISVWLEPQAAMLERVHSTAATNDAFRRGSVI